MVDENEWRYYRVNSILAYLSDNGMRLGSIKSVEFHVV